MAPAAGPEEEDLEACEADGLTVAHFWGICDVKYDPRLPEGERVKVLELGDGKASRFSGHGVATREKFRSEYCLALHYLRLDVLVENKHLTHDRFLGEGFRNLRPKAMPYLRQYEQALAGRILKDLEIQMEEAVVLKLCNRNRGAGVVVVPAAQLDSTLRRLLTPPGGAELEALLKQRTEAALRQEPSGDFEEQCLHWWSNEYPCFLAEACCHSLPVQVREDEFDGTLRVAFVLRKKVWQEGELEWVESESEGPSYEVDWLGGYWKLPREAVGSGCQDTSLEAVRARVVSSFSSAEKRTAEVEEAHLQEVYAALTPALLRVLRVAGAADLMSDYKSQPLARAFLSARVAAAVRGQKMRQARGLLDMAKSFVKQASVDGREPRGLAERAVLSYIDRNLAVCLLMDIQHHLPSRPQRIKTRNEALSALNSALRWLPTNATAFFVRGRFHHDSGEFKEAASFLWKALALDPDFKTSYLALGNCLLQLGDHPGAMEASSACLRRHVDSPTAQFNLGQAYYHLLIDGAVDLAHEAEWRQLAERSLTFAKAQDAKMWRPQDECMLSYVLGQGDARSNVCRAPVSTRKVYGWRP